MKVVIFLCVLAFAYSQLPHGHELQQLVDAAFDRLDHSPKDDHVTEAEFSWILQRDDADNNTCVTLDEYLAHTTATAVIATQIFHEFNKDGDNCMNTADMVKEFAAVDHDGDMQISKHEFEHYYVQLLKRLDHAHGGHAVG